MLLSHDGSRLETDQMYWDAERGFLQSKPLLSKILITIWLPRLDTNKEFSKFQTGKLTGTMLAGRKRLLIADEKL